MSDRDITHASRLTSLRLNRELLATATGPERAELESRIVMLERLTKGFWTDSQMRRDWERRERDA